MTHFKNNRNKVPEHEHGTLSRPSIQIFEEKQTVWQMMLQRISYRRPDQQVFVPCVFIGYGAGRASAWYPPRPI